MIAGVELFVNTTLFPKTSTLMVWCFSARRHARLVVNVITKWRSFLIILRCLSQPILSKSKLFNQPAKLFASPRKEKGYATIRGEMREAVKEGKVARCPVFHYVSLLALLKYGLRSGGIIQMDGISSGDCECGVAGMVTNIGADFDAPASSRAEANATIDGQRSHGFFIGAHSTTVSTIARIVHAMCLLLSKGTAGHASAGHSQKCV